MVSPPAPAAQSVTRFPLDASAAIDAIFANGLGTIVEFILMIAVYILVLGVIIMLIAAGISRLSINSGGQKQTADYFVDAFIILIIVVIVGSSPEILSALGFQAAENFSAIDVISGG